MTIRITWEKTIKGNQIVLTKNEVQSTDNGTYCAGICTIPISIITVIVGLSFVLPSSIASGEMMFPILMLVFVPMPGIIMLLVGLYGKRHPNTTRYLTVFTLDSDKQVIRIEEGPLSPDGQEVIERKRKIKEYPLQKIKSVTIEQVGQRFDVYLNLIWRILYVFQGSDLEAVGVRREIEGFLSLR